MELEPPAARRRFASWKCKSHTKFRSNLLRETPLAERAAAFLALVCLDKILLPYNYGIP